MSLAKVLESRFRGDIRFRGQAYVASERVEITHVTDERVYGVVHDGQEFQTQLSREESRLATFCTCAQPGEQEVLCKHVWATILATDDEGYVSSPPRSGYFPPFLAIEDPTTLDFDDDLLGDLTPGDVFIPPPTAQRERPQAPQVEKPLTEWERKLKVISDELDEGELSSATTRDREIVYHLDLAASREHGQIVIDVVQRQRRANGAWGKVKPLKLKPGKLEEIEHEDDSRVLALMGGGVVDRTNWLGQPNDFQSAMYRYRLPPDLAREVLPAICATGRLVILNAEGETDEQPLKWDDGPPWELSMKVVFEEESETWTGRPSDSQRDGENE